MENDAFKDTSISEAPAVYFRLTRDKHSVFN